MVPLFILGGSLGLCPMTTESQLHFCEMLSGGQAESRPPYFLPYFSCGSNNQAHTFLSDKEPQQEEPMDWSY